MRSKGQKKKKLTNTKSNSILCDTMFQIDVVFEKRYGLTDKKKIVW